MISSIVDEILKAFRLPERQQRLALPQLLRKLKIILEGHYTPTSGDSSSRS